MIVVETSLRSIQTLRQAYEQRMVGANPQEIAWLQGALTMLAWIEQGDEPPMDPL